MLASELICHNDKCSLSSIFCLLLIVMLKFLSLSYSIKPSISSISIMQLGCESEVSSFCVTYLVNNCLIFCTNDELSSLSKNDVLFKLFSCSFFCTIKTFKPESDIFNLSSFSFKSSFSDD